MFLQRSGRKVGDLVPLSSVLAVLGAEGCAIWGLWYPGRVAESMGQPQLFFQAWWLWHLLTRQASFLIFNLLIVAYLWVGVRSLDRPPGSARLWVRCGYVALALTTAAIQVAVHFVHRTYYTTYTLKVIYDVR